MITREQFDNLAKLSRLQFSDEEYIKFSTQIDPVLKYMDVLNEVNTDSIKPTQQVNNLINIFEQDVVLPAQASGSDLLKCTTLPVESNQILVMKVIN